MLDHNKSPQECLDLIPDKRMSMAQVSHPIAPVECRHANRAWAECQVNLVSFSTDFTDESDEAIKRELRAWDVG